MTDDTIAIVSTSINPRPTDYAEWAKQGVLIVAGDLNTPSELGAYVTTELAGIYIRPEHQERYAFSDVLGWKCIQRRNAAVMYAYELGYDYVLTVDDDNRPASPTFVDHHVSILKGDHRGSEVIVASEQWINTGDFLEPPSWQRGTPYGFTTRWWKHNYNATRDVVVSQAQAIGSPDCDAVTRITIDPVVAHVAKSVIVDSGSLCIFNSQATMWRGDYAPLIACLPGVGRYDDVIASVIAQKILHERELCVYVGAPAAYQERNEHDLTKDLRAERWGMMNLPKIVEVLDGLDIEQYFGETWEAYDVYAWIADALENHNALPRDTTRFMKAWATEWRLAALKRAEIGRE